jgi:hypothetical protein
MAKYVANPGICSDRYCIRPVYAKGLCKRDHNRAFLAAHPGYANRARKKYRDKYPEKQKQNSRRVRDRFSSGRTQAKRAGRVWELTLGQYAVLLSYACNYCHGPLNPTGSGLDRLDNHGGYTWDNVVPCCLACNVLKGRIEGCGFTFPRTVELIMELKNKCSSKEV